MPSSVDCRSRIERVQLGFQKRHIHLARHETRLDARFTAGIATGFADSEKLEGYRLARLAKGQEKLLGLGIRNLVFDVVACGCVVERRAVRQIPNLPPPLTDFSH